MESREERVGKEERGREREWGSIAALRPPTTTSFRRLRDDRRGGVEEKGKEGEWGGKEWEESKAREEGEGE